MLKWNKDKDMSELLLDIIKDNKYLNQLSKKYNKELNVRIEETIVDVKTYVYEIQFGNDEEIPIYILIELNNNYTCIENYLGGELNNKDLEKEYIELMNDINSSMKKSIREII